MTLMEKRKNSFKNSEQHKELPNKIDVYLTSNDNSPGVIYNTWMDGNELYFRFPKVRNDIFP